MLFTIPDIDKCLKNSNEKCDENKICKQENENVVCLPGMILLFRIEDGSISLIDLLFCSCFDFRI